MAWSDILSALMSPSSQDGYDQGAAIGTNPQSPIAQAIANPGGTAPLTPLQVAMAQANNQSPQTNMNTYGYSGMAPQGAGVTAQPSTPLQAAMATGMQGAGAPQSSNQPPIAQAMANPDGTTTPTPMQAAMAQAPQAPLSAIQQMFQNQTTNPNLALSNGLIGAGSAMLQGKNFMQGMGAAGDAFNNGFDGTLDQQRQLNTPKVTPLPDGTFSIVQMPGQQPQVISNAQVQDFVMGKMKAQVSYDMMKQTAAKNDQIQVNAAKTDQTQGVAAQTALINLQQSQQGLQQAQATTEALKQDPARSLALKTYAALPAVAQRIAAASGFGKTTQAARDYNTLNNAALDATKFEVSGINGSLSNDEFNKAAGAIPKPSDDPAVWDEYYGRVTPLLSGRQQFYTDIAQRGLSAGNRSVNPSGDNGRPVVAAPQASAPSGASVPTVTDAASYAAIPPGGYYRTPDGGYRHKKM
ncbi:hypothetical protein [Paraburkholderia fungorum]|uniref:hypothetical protein n=1 Tax=Paraburkholderia fungorum TaxID=134537 RepID=UPI0020927AF8|nr:hypothetical protein [Paraburkholderia fungorum]USU15360.1 hypothetical protein NFE55_17510 [Paraburkholderia fungorum]USU23305.1 hypothetical protein NFS19_17510 [Paraburkholderia fungorum]